MQPEQEHRTPGVVRRALALWWLPVAGLLVGLVIGLVATRGGDGEFEATATVYLGRPLAPVGSSQLRSFQTDPSTVRQIVRSQAVVREVADEVGVGAGRLRRGVSTNVITRAFGRQIEQTEIVEITVRGPWRAETALAANDLADVVVTRVSSYPDAKIGGLERLLEAQNRELQDLETTLGDLGPAVSTGEGLSDELSTEFLTIVIANEQRRIQLRGDREQTEAALTQARE
ncbi:MAG: hypothetical protein ACE5EV_06385, partial [Gaiellales bacterium]